MLVERSLLQQDVVADADLADVVQQPGPLDALDVVLRHAHHPTHRLRDVAHPARVVPGVRIARVDRLRQRLDGLLEQLPGLDVARVRQPRGEQRNDEERGRPPADAVRQHEDLGHEPRQGCQPDEVGRHARNVLRPNDSHRHRRFERATAATARTQVRAKKTALAISARTNSTRDSRPLRGSGARRVVDHAARLLRKRQPPRGCRACRTTALAPRTLPLVGGADQANDRCGGRSTENMEAKIGADPLRRRFRVGGERASRSRRASRPSRRRGPESRRSPAASGTGK